MINAREASQLSTPVHFTNGVALAAYINERVTQAAQDGLKMVHLAIPESWGVKEIGPTCAKLRHLGYKAVHKQEPGLFGDNLYVPVKQVIAISWK